MLAVRLELPQQRRLGTDRFLKVESIAGLARLDRCRGAECADRGRSAVAGAGTGAGATAGRQRRKHRSGRQRRKHPARRLPDDWADLLAQQGFFRAWTPVEHGGFELPTADLMRVLETLAIADASTCWCVSINTTSAIGLSTVPEAVRGQIASSELARFAGVFAPQGIARATGDGKFQVTGRWPFGSAVSNADWVLGGCRFLNEQGEPILDDSGNPRQHMVWFPRSVIRGLDNWHVSGLCGSGSADFAVDDAQTSIEFVSGWLLEDRIDRPLYRHPVFTLLGMGFAALALGAAIGGYRDVLANLKSRFSDADGTLKVSSDIRRQLAVEEARIRSARVFFYSTVQTVWEACLSGRPSLVLRKDMRSAVLHAVQGCIQALDVFFDIGGTSSIHKTAAIQRRVRDLRVLSQHIMVRPNLLPVLGAISLGDTPQGARFL